MSKNALGKAPNGNGQRIKNPLLEDHNWLWEQKWGSGKSVHEIGNIIGVDGGTVANRLNKFGIGGKTHPWLKDADILYHMYIILRLSAKEIADRIGVCRNTVHTWLSNHEITKIRCNGPDKGLVWAAPTMKELYFDCGYTQSEIADHLNCSTSGVSYVMEKYDMPVKREFASGENHHFWNGGKVTVECYVCGETKKIKPSHKERSDRHFCSMECESNWRKKHLSGSNHPNWKGGSVYYYGPNWHSQRIKAVIRDQSRCQWCSKTPVDLGEELHVHHRVRLRKYKDKYNSPKWWEQGNRVENLITLCHSCHKTWEWMPVQPQCHE